MDLGNALFQRGGLFGILFHYSLTSVSISANESGISTWVLLRLEYCIEIVNTPAIPASDMSADMVYRTVGQRPTVKRHSPSAPSTAEASAK